MILRAGDAQVRIREGRRRCFAYGIYLLVDVGRGECEHGRGREGGRGFAYQIHGGPRCHNGPSNGRDGSLPPRGGGVEWMVPFFGGKRGRRARAQVYMRNMYVEAKWSSVGMRFCVTAPRLASTMAAAQAGRPLVFLLVVGRMVLSRQGEARRGRYLHNQL